MTFQDDINRMLAEGYATMAVHGADCAIRSGLPSSQSMTCTCAMPGPLGLLPSGTIRTDVPEPTLTVKRHSAFVSVSTELALDAGFITEEQARAQGWTPYVPPPIPWHRRARWRWQAWRERAGRKVGGWLAGVDLSERDED